MSRGKEVASNSRGILLFPRRTSNFLGWTAWLSFSFLFFPVSRRFVTFESILLFLHPDSQGPSSSILSRIRPVAPAHWLAARIYTDFLPISSPFSRNKSCVFAYKRPFNITEALIYRHEERPCILPLPFSLSLSLHPSTTPVTFVFRRGRRERTTVPRFSLIYRSLPDAVFD